MHMVNFLEEKKVIFGFELKQDEKILVCGYSGVDDFTIIRHLAQAKQ